jgi:RHS repeat-associated protein
MTISNATGSVVTQYAYLPYGDSAPPNLAACLGAGGSSSTCGSPSGTGFGYDGYRYDPETGLYHTGARYYNPRLGRFIQPDQIGQAGGLNLYSYVQNDPLNLTDPSGQDAFGVYGSIGAEAGICPVGTAQSEGIGFGVFYPGSGISGFVSVLFSGNVRISAFRSSTDANLGGNSGSQNFVAGASAGGGIGGFYASGIRTVAQLGSISPNTYTINTPAVSVGITANPSGSQSLITVTVPRGPGLSLSNVPSSTTTLFGAGK